MPRDNAMDPEQALDAAVELMRGYRFQALAELLGDECAAEKVTAVADKFVAWLRGLKSITLTLVAIEEQDGASAPITPTEGAMTTIDTSQQARYVISAADDRGFDVDSTLEVSVDGTSVTAEILEATSGTASGKDELLVKAVGTGSSLVKVFDPAQPDVVFGSDSVDVIAGALAAVVLEAPVVEEQAEEPAPTP